MAHKKGQGSSRNGRDSNSQRLGVKAHDGNVVTRGGPSGGDGGHGGSVYIVASPHINTLINFRFHPLFDAERGEHGMGSNCTGRGGKDLELEVPIGTLVYEKIPPDPENPEHPE